MDINFLGIKLLNNSLSNQLYPSWNFGPRKEDCRSVKYLVENIEKLLKKYLFLIPKNILWNISY